MKVEEKSYNGDPGPSGKAAGIGVHRVRVGIRYVMNSEHNEDE